MKTYKVYSKNQYCNDGGCMVTIIRDDGERDAFCYGDPEKIFNDDGEIDGDIFESAEGTREKIIEDCRGLEAAYENQMDANGFFNYSLYRGIADWFDPEENSNDR